jgi:RNA polymerase sigma-70 factor (ECF subfamily)
MAASDARAVLALARQGDAEAFRALVEQHSRGAFRLAFRITGNEQDAEDVVQESFLRAFRRLWRFEARADFGTWLHRIVANCALDVLRSRETRRQQNPEVPFDSVTSAPPSEAPGPDRLTESAEIQRRVAAAFAGLSPLERTAFVLRHFEGRSVHDISRTLGLGRSAAKQAVFRAVRKLRVELEPCHTTHKTT